VIFALLAAGAMFGFVGVLIAVPAAAIVGVLIRFLVGRYSESDLFLGPDGTGGPDVPGGPDGEAAP
jgi:predicted PurR-regulated permease PerM